MIDKHRVLIVSGQDLKADLRGTVLCRKDVKREWISDIHQTLDRIALFKPHLIVIDWPDEALIYPLMHSIRHHDSTKEAAIVVVSRTLTADAEKELINAGANLILPIPLHSGLWNKRLDQLLNVTPRFNTRVGVTFALWSINLSEDKTEVQGMAMNLSYSGMLIKTRMLLVVGSKLDIRFTLPGQDCQLNVVGQIMWSMQASATVCRSGIQFIVMRHDARERIMAFIDASQPGGPSGMACLAGMGVREETADWERELRISEARKMTLLDASNEGIVSVDSEGHILEFNTAAESIFGFQRSAVLGKLLDDTLVPSSQRDILHSRFRWLITEKADLFETLKFTATGLRSDGTEFPAEVSMTPMMVKGRLLFSFFLRDVSALRQAVEARQQLEAQLRQSQKLEAVGTLAGGIAHDFNNILAAIMGYTELSMGSVPEGNQARKYLEKILKSTMRARDLVKQILAFSRKGMEKREPVQVSSIIKESVKLLRATLPSTIEIRQHINDETCMVNSTPTHIYQVLMNLCTNAAHAMTEAGGVIDIFLDAVFLDERQATDYADLSRGAYLKLSVRDTGIGITPECIPRIFEAFFTTKEAGRGTGMGLAVVHGIIKSHGGEILVESKPGKGSTFHVLLPRIEAAAVKASGEEKPVPTGTERILLVDDEKTLVDVWQEQFGALGYSVVAKQSGREALKAFQKDPDSFDLVITDMTMPHMPGDVLAKKILEIRPDMPIIICTGFSEKISIAKVKELGIKTLVMKPMPFKEIAKTIRTVLKAHARQASPLAKNKKR
jgi:PAS domain S-box-containing protein